MSAETAASTDILVVGGGLGGVAAALAALARGRTVLLTEETDWIGGQLTSQGVPPDEHAWIEQFGATRTYRALREAIRDHYRRWYPLTDEARRGRYLNPGEGRVSTLCHEPRVAAAVLDAMVAPYVAAGRLRILYGHRPVAASMDGDRVRSVVVEGPDATNGCYRLHPVEWNIGEAAGSLAAYCLDNRLEAEQVYEDGERLSHFQDELTCAGVELAWPEVKGY